MSADPRPPKLFGRKSGHPLSASLQATLDDAWPRLALAREDLPDFAAQFTRPYPRYALEIGFGAGEHLLARAQENPDMGFIGCDVFRNGIARLTANIERLRLDNIRLYADDARPLLAHLPDGCLDYIYLLYPDPWPKARHAKRRIVSADMLAAAWRVMRPDGELQIASDIADYIGWSLMHLRRHGGFEWLARTPQDWRDPPQGWPGTRYETKARRQGRETTYLRLRRRRTPQNDVL